MHKSGLFAWENSALTCLFPGLFTACMFQCLWDTTCTRPSGVTPVR